MENAATIEYREIKEQIDKLLTKITAEIAAEQAKDEKREINLGDVGTAQRYRSQLIQLLGEIRSVDVTELEVYAEILKELDQ